MDTQVLVTITEVPREFKDMVMDITRGLLLLVIMVMDMVESVTITEVPRESKDMVTDITRGLLHLVIMVMDMDLLMYMLNRRIMDMVILSLMSMDTISIKDQLMLDMAMVVTATNMLTDPTLITRSKVTTQKPTITDITRGPLLLVIMVMDMDLPMSMLNRRTMDMDILSPMSMDTISIKDQLMHPMKATNMFLILHTPTMKLRCTTLTKRQIEIVPQLFSSAMSIIPR